MRTPATMVDLDGTHGIDPLRATADLDGHVSHTAVRALPWLERLVGVPVWAKLESTQHTGSFKFRGAYLAVARGSGQPVIAASAGNHGLAVAEAARQLGKKANICVPVVASRLKRERILATGAGLIEHGNALEDAIEHVRGLAEANDLDYISPYNNRDVVAGASTIALEFLSDVPSLTTMIAPIGGGGLISGLGIGAEAAHRDVELIGCEPSRYATMTASLAAGGIVRVVHQPTFADGLAVNLEADSITYPLVRRYVAETITLSEEELAAATLALLVHESILVEPAGAAGVIACLRLAQQGRLTGPVGIPLCGGNLTHGTLSRIQRFPYRDPDLVRLLDLRGRRVTDMPVLRARPVRERATERDDLGDRLGELTDQLSTCLDELGAAVHSLDEHVDYAAENDLVVDEALVRRLRDLAEDTRQRIRWQRDSPADDGEGGADRFALDQAVLRFGLATVAHVRGALEWCSPSYAQSRVAQFFDTGVQDSPTVNYERYESKSVQRVESQLMEVLDLRPDEHAVSVTSSGMAAYTLLESFLLRARLKAGDTVLRAPYVYFEADEQLAALPFLRFERAPRYSTEEIIAAVRAHRPRCLFIDPVANTAVQRMVDLPAVLDRLRSTVTEPITVVVDGTMLSGAMPAGALVGGGLVEVLYYESCSKYLQLGLDAGMAGLLVYPVQLRAHFDRLRRNTGTILYRHYADLFPRYDRTLFRRRMRRIGANALRLATRLHDDPRVRELGMVCYPGHDSHPDVAIARKLPYAGGCVTYVFHEPGRNHHTELEPLLDHVVAGSKRLGLHVTKGVSFGFSAPRVSAAASMAETEPPFLRLYAGDQTDEQVDRFAEVVAEALVR
ncbi:MULTISPECIES: pyridoxal-phosphate dependent enzyme [Actinosynnema]|uniref:pyridoxal-phosphate dependent enzyme n=1 Tax=Actinosynnema TaxID=40566 RepID=UPI0020A4FE47|nr:pyridoxal-phosphate dependent enzyme [Actinosynnema pretiosum]MCP2097837.1 Threonine dehydratase [Actinosynnema pretiosum]